MEVIYIECKKMHSMDEFYDELSKKLNFPEYFGKNLDALNDILDETEGDILLTFYGYESFIRNVGEKAETAKEILIEKRDKKTNFRVMFES